MEFFAETRYNSCRFIKRIFDLKNKQEGCRRGIEHDYDIVEGPMADDQIWNVVEGFVDGRISRDIFWGLAKFNHLTHQIVFCTEEALKTLTFQGSDIL